MSGLRRVSIFDRRLTAELREKLKKPVGRLIEGLPEDNIEKMKSIVEEVKPVAVAVVGDVVSSMAIAAGIPVKIYVADGRVMRSLAGLSITGNVDIVFRAKNPPGLITRECIEVLREAVEYDGSVWVWIDGEEDLTVIPLVILMPIGSLVIYGQPHLGFVAVYVDEEKKREMLQIMDSMEPI
ncbi:MAG: GTP-dependent dephospho-CoA kinase family protein [Candidatus Bathyarchaeota archaeon]|nr:GTP-dependent dephospho-CoA kinase family protein [Candidatus Bathyarchaeota archaeon]